MAKRCPAGTKKVGNKCEESEEIIPVTVTLTKLEWEIINQALGSPIRGNLIQSISDLGVDASEQEILDAWDSVSDKWQRTWS